MDSPSDDEPFPPSVVSYDVYPFHPGFVSDNGEDDEEDNPDEDKGDKQHLTPRHKRKREEDQDDPGRRQGRRPPEDGEEDDPEDCKEDATSTGGDSADKEQEPDKLFGARAPVHPSYVDLPLMYPSDKSLERHTYEALKKADARGDLDARIRILKRLERDLVLSRILKRTPNLTSAKLAAIRRRLHIRYL